MSKASKTKKQTEVSADSPMAAEPVITPKKASKPKNKKQPQVITDSPIAAEPVVTAEIEVVQTVVPEIIQSEVIENLPNSAPIEDTSVTAIVPQEAVIELSTEPTIVQDEPAAPIVVETVKPEVTEIPKPKVRVICWKFTDAWYNRHENYKSFNLPQEIAASISCYNQVKYIKNVSIMVIDGQPPITLSNY